LIYLIIGLCPNIGFAIVKLAQQMENPSNEYYQAGLYLCRYLLNTCKYQIVYNGLSNKSVVAHSDSELHKSMTSYFILMPYRVTFWMSY